MRHLYPAALALGLLAACEHATPTSSTPTTADGPAALDQPDAGQAYHAPRVRSFPTSAARVNDWIKRQDMPAIRAHAWDIWESINTTAPNGLPIWENWYSGHELFEQVGGPRLTLHDFNSPQQFFHVAHAKGKKARIPVDAAERPVAFNRYSPSLAHFIWNNQLYDSAVLGQKYRQLVQAGTPLAQLGIQTSKDSTDAKSFALKPVFQFISGDRPTVIPYWAGAVTQATTNLTQPEPHTWRQGVIVDPTGKLKPGTTARMRCNGELLDMPVVALDEFYHIKITEEEAKNYSTFADSSGDEVGRHDQGSPQAIKVMVKAGNYALLTGMHVTGKEISNWTWQTFWWSPNHHDPNFGNDRPRSLRKPWNNYDMLAAYYMVAPPNIHTGGTAVSGQPLVVYNPYLETNLTGTVPNGRGDSTTTWFGVFSNCMSCHRMAAWPNNDYVPGGFIGAGDPKFFQNNLKTDFLWSIPTRARQVTAPQLQAMLLRQQHAKQAK